MNRRRHTNPSFTATRRSTLEVADAVYM